MRAQQVLSLDMQQQELQPQQLQQQLRRNINRLADSSRGTRLQGARNILSVYSAEAARRASQANQTSEGTTGSKISSNIRCAFGEIFLSSLYIPVSELCADEASESCRATALELLQLVVTEFLPRKDIIALCSGGIKIRDITSSGVALRNSTSNGTCCDSRNTERECAASSSSSSSNSLVVTLAKRLRGDQAAAETSEELRSKLLEFLQHLLLQYAADPPLAFKGRIQTEERHNQQQQGWDATALADCMLTGVLGSLREKSPSNAIQACILLSAISMKIQASVLLQSVKQLLERLAFCLSRCQRAVRWQALDAYDSLLTAICSRASTATAGAANAAASHILTAVRAIRHSLQHETAIQNKLRVVQMLKNLLGKTSPRVLLRPNVQTQTLLVLVLLLGDSDKNVGLEALRALMTVAPRCVAHSQRQKKARDLKETQREQDFLGEEDDDSTDGENTDSNEGEEEEYGSSTATETGLCSSESHSEEAQSLQLSPNLLTELMESHLDGLMADLLPRLTSWSSDERLSSLRAVAALLTICGPQLLWQLPRLLTQLYGFCAAVDGGSLAGSQQAEHQHGSPLLLLVEHAIIRELRNNDVLTTNSSDEPWHCGGLQEMGASSSLCHSLEELELSLRCAGQVALLVPPCAWLPLIANHLGLLHEARLYSDRKEAAISAAISGESATERYSDGLQAANTKERRFLQQFPNGYKSVIEAIRLSEERAWRNKAANKAAAPDIVSPLKGQLCSVQAKKQALLLLARLLRGLRPNTPHQNPSQQQHHEKSKTRLDDDEKYQIGEEEIWLLVHIIESVQSGGSCGGNDSATTAALTAAYTNDELLPYVAAPLLQLVHAAGHLCKGESRRLFAASLVQQVNQRSPPEITKAAVRCVCECTGKSRLLLYVSFIEDFVSTELERCFTHDDSEIAAVASTVKLSGNENLAAEISKNSDAIWAGSDIRPLLLLHALHGAQEALDSEGGRPDILQSAWLQGLLQVLKLQGTASTAAAAVRADVMRACLALFSLSLFIPIVRPYGEWVLQNLLVPNLHWRPGEANAKLRKVALLCVSQIIPTLSGTSTNFSCSPIEQGRDFGVLLSSHSRVGTQPSRFQNCNDGSCQVQQSTAETTSEDDSQKDGMTRSIELLSPLLVCCLDDDWNADVRALAVGVVRQLFLDLQGSKRQHDALQQLAAATVGPLQQRLDDARDEIRVAAALALEALLLERPMPLHRGTATEVCKNLCVCLDDRNEDLASAAAAALLACADVLEDVLVEVIHGAECRCLFPGRYADLLASVQRSQKSTTPSDIPHKLTLDVSSVAR